MRQLLLLAFASPAAVAQFSPAVRSERLYLNNSGVLLGSTRVISLGGAYVGVGEGVAGFTSNLASLAHRAPHLDRDWDVGFTLSWLDLPFLSPRLRDLDNDGAGDNALRSTQWLFGLMLQYKRFGVGMYSRSTALAYCALSHPPECPPTETIDIYVGNLALAGAVALGRDDFILSLGIYGAEATFQHHEQRRAYQQTGVEFDILYRPCELNYRVGVSVKPQVVAFYRQKPDETTTLAGRPLYAAVVSPAVLSLGGSIRLGEGSWRYNRLSPAARRDIGSRLGPEWVPPELPEDAPLGAWMLTGQVDLIGATESTVPIQSFVDIDVATGLVEPTRVGDFTQLSLRLGVEHETVPNRLRTRLGTFIEPSPYHGVKARPHLTGGLEVFVFEYFEKWALSASFDVASRYYNVGASVGFWR